MDYSTLAATRLTTNLTPSKKRKIQQNLKIVTFLMKVLGYSNIGDH